MAASEDNAGESSVASRPETPYAVVAAIVAAVGYVLGYLILRNQHPDLSQLPKLAAGTSTFALLYVYAQAIERVLVPVSWFGGGFLPGGSTKKSVQQNRQRTVTAALADPASGTKAEEAAKATHAADQYRANLTATTFGVASLLAFVAVGYSGSLLLNIMGVHTDDWVDLLVTGLAIAGGTKPLHDLIDNVTKSSAAKSAATT